MRKLFVFFCILSLLIAKMVVTIQAHPMDFLKEYEAFEVENYCVSRYDFEHKKTDLTFMPDNAYIENFALSPTRFFVWIYDNHLQVCSSVSIYDSQLNLLKNIPSFSSTVTLFSDDGAYAFNNQVWLGPTSNRKCYVAILAVKDGGTARPLDLDENIKYWECLFLRDNRTFVYRTSSNVLWKYDCPTQKKTRWMELDEDVVLGKPAYLHPWIPYTTGDSIYILNYETNEKKLIRKFDDPGFFSFTTRENGKPMLLGSVYCWREDDKGFVFYMSDTSLFNLENYIQPFAYKRHSKAYYFDLESGKEYALPEMAGKKGWRKKKR